MAKSYLVLFIGVLSISFAAIFIRLADAPPLVIAAYRLAIAAAIIIPFTASRTLGSLRGLSRRDLLLILLSSFFIALHFGLWITSLSYTSIASSVVLVTAHPAFVAIVSYFLWGERLNRLIVGGIAIALGGVFLLNYGGFAFGPQAVMGNLLALVAGFAMGAYLIVGRQLRTNIDMLSYLTIIYTGAAVLLLVAVVISGHGFLGYSPVTYLMLILLALVPQLIGHSSLNLAVRLIPVTLVSVAILGEPVGATILGTVILSEIPTITEILGGLLIIGGIFIVVRYGSKKRL